MSKKNPKGLKHSGKLAIDKTEKSKS